MDELDVTSDQKEALNPSEPEVLVAVSDEANGQGDTDAAPKPHMTKKEKREARQKRNFLTLNDLCTQLNETDPVVRYQFRYIIGSLHTRAVYEVMHEALEIEANGGMMTVDGSRRRTVGGIFFELARSRIEKRKPRAPQPDSGLLPVQPEPYVPPMAWEERLPMLAELFQEMGEAMTVKLTLIGRPGRVVVRGNMVVTAIKHEAKPVSLPSGLPTMPLTTTVYTVYISKKQWKKVEGNLSEDAEDKLIIEGVGVLDSEAKAMAVFATGVKSLGAERKKHPPKKPNDAPQEAAPAEAAAPGVEAPVAPLPPPPTRPLRHSRFTEDIVAVPTVLPVVEATTNMPPDVAEKLNGLRTTEKMYQQKIETLESKPEGQRFGLDMTRKLLKKVEDDIAAIEQQY